MVLEASDLAQIKSIIESLLIVSGDPLCMEDIHETLQEKWTLTIPEIVAVINTLKEEYQAGSRGLQITEIAEKFQICTNSQNADWVKKYLKIKNAEGLTKPALETIAIIAYRQPITKLEIEGIRGVNVDGVLKKLLDKGLIKTRGKKEMLGHPFLYVTTEKFLDYFGLSSTDDLPKREELQLRSSKLPNIDDSAKPAISPGDKAESVDGPVIENDKVPNETEETPAENRQD